MAMPETGKPDGFVPPVRPTQAADPPLTSVATQIWPPLPSRGPSPSVPAYITLDDPSVSVTPPAAIDRTRFTSPPVQVSVPPVSKLSVSGENPVPSVAPRH